MAMQIFGIMNTDASNEDWKTALAHQKRAGGSPCLQAWGGSSRPIDTKTTQYVDLQFIDFRYKICYNFSSEKR